MSTAIANATSTPPSISQRLGNTDAVVDFFSHWESLLFLVWIPLVFLAGRYIFRIPYWLHDRTFSLKDQLTTVDNKACATSFAAFCFSLGLILQGAFSDPLQDSGTNVYTAIIWSCIGIVYLMLSQFLNDLLLHRKINYQEQILKQNLAVGILNAGMLVSSAIIARYTIAGKVVVWWESLASSAILWCITQLFFVAFIQLYDVITVGVDEQEELLKGNNAVGVSLAMSTVACAILLSSPIEVSESIVALVIWFALAVVLLLFFKFIARVFLAPNELVEEGGRPSNAAVSSIEGATLLFVSLGLRSLITYRGCAVDTRPWTARIVDVDFAMSIFTYYNIAFPFIIFAYLLVTRATFSLPHLFRYLRRGNRSVIEAIQSYLDRQIVYAADAAVAQQELAEKPTDALSGVNQAATAVSRYSSSRSIAFAGFLVGNALVLRGALAGTVDSLANPGPTIAYMLFWLMFGAAVLAINNLLITLFLWRRVTRRRDDNASTAVIEAFAYFTSGLNVGGALMSLQGAETHGGGQTFDWGNDLAVILLFSIMQQVAVILFGKLYQLITPYDDVAEVENDNFAAGWSSALIFVAFGVITSAPIQRTDSVALYWIYVVMAFLYVMLHRVFVDKVILIGRALSDEITQDRNWGAALIEGCTAIGAAMALTSLLRAPC